MILIRKIEVHFEGGDQSVGEYCYATELLIIKDAIEMMCNVHGECRRRVNIDRDLSCRKQGEHCEVTNICSASPDDLV